MDVYSGVRLSVRACGLTTSACTCAIRVCLNALEWVAAVLGSDCTVRPCVGSCTEMQAYVVV
jgi:hypothetical protein